MKVHSNGKIADDNEYVEIAYLNNLVGIQIDNRFRAIPYQEFLEMANEIVRQKEENDARTT